MTIGGLAAPTWLADLGHWPNCRPEAPDAPPSLHHVLVLKRRGAKLVQIRESTARAVTAILTDRSIAISMSWKNARRRSPSRFRRRSRLQGHVRRQIPERPSQSHRRRRVTAGLLRLSGPALDPFTYNKPHRITLGHGAAPDQDHQASRLPRCRPGDGVQTHRSRPLACGERATTGRTRPCWRPLRGRCAARTARGRCSMSSHPNTGQPREPTRPCPWPCGC